MTAASFTKKISRLLTIRNARKGVSLGVVVTMLINPVTLMANQYNIQDRISSGKNYADEVFQNDHSGNNWGNNTSVFNSDLSSYSFKDESGNDKTIPMSDLFQASSQDTSFKSQYGMDDEEFQQIGKDKRDSLQDEDSPSGQSYNLLRDSVYLSKPDVNQDTLWKSSEMVIGGTTGQTPFDSSECNNGSNHVPDLRTCQKENMLTGICEVRHFYDIEPVMAPEEGFANFTTCGENCVTMWIGKHDNDSDYTGNCTVFEEKVKVRMANPEAIVSATLIEMAVDDYVQFWKVNQDESKDLIWQSHTYFPPETVRYNGQQLNYWEQPDRMFGSTSFYDAYRGTYGLGGNSVPGMSPFAGCERKSSDVFKPYKDITGILKNNADSGEVVEFLLKTSVAGSGEGFAQIEVKYDPKKLIKTDYWGDPDCIERAKLYQTNSNSGNFVQCVDMPDEVNSDGCFAIQGTKICEEHMVRSELPFAGSPFCRQYGVERPASFANDITGTECEALDKDPRCGFIKSTCVDSPPNKQVNDLFNHGLGRNPSPVEYQYWYALISAPDASYDVIRTDFFEWARNNNEPMINEFSCKVFEETWDCGYPPGGYSTGACAIGDMLNNDFAECEMELVPTDQPGIVKTYRTETCQEALYLTECQVERTVQIMDRNAKRSVGIAGCVFEQPATFGVPWAGQAISASATFQKISGENISFTITEQPSESNGWVVKGLYKGDAYVDVDTGIVTCSENPSISGKIYMTGKSLTMQEVNMPAPGEETNDPCLREKDSYSDVSWTCQQTQAMVGGDWANVIPPISSTLPVNCLKAHAVYDTRDYGKGQLCWEGHEGAAGCDTIDETTNALEVGQDNCSELKSKEQTGECKYLGTFPIQDSTGSEDAKFNYIWEHRYDCEDGSYETEPPKEPKYTCEGIVRCMGDECANPEYIENSDFGKAAGMLQMLQEVDGDMNCDVGADGKLTNCKVFSGEAQTCMQALGSYIDCCESPEGGPTLSDYVTTYKVGKRMGNYAMNSEWFQPVKAGYQSVANTVSNTYTAVSDWVAQGVEPLTNSASSMYSQASTYATETFGQLFSTSSSAVSSTTSSISSSISGAYDAMGIALDNLKNKMLEKTKEYLTDAFGEQVSNMFIKEGVTQGTFQAGALSQSIMSVVSVVGWIYAAYQIATLVAQMYYKCTTDMIGLASDIPLLKTHYVGSYCSSRAFWGDCLETQRSYCKFASPLARILNEQLRPQFGRDWGSPKNPDCSGISIDELVVADWNQVDLSEWMDILNVTDNAPNQDISMDTLTGQESFLGNQFNKPPTGNPLGNTGASTGSPTVYEERLNTAERNIERLKNSDLDASRTYSSEKLWSQY